MAEQHTIGIISDIHYAGAAEKARGNDFEFRDITNPLLRLFVQMHRRFIWMREPLNQNYLVDDFVARAAGFDYVVANGDFSCNTAFVGVSDEAACQSAQECLQKLRARFGSRLLTTYGDHELGKISFVGGRGGMRLESWRCARERLNLAPFWKMELGKYVLIGVVSSLIALPVYEADTLPAERDQWRQLRSEHLSHITTAFAALKSDQRVLLFCHDPTALPFLGREEEIRARLGQIEQTVIGHLHSNLILWNSRRLAGMPTLTFLGHTAKRLSRALGEAQYWRPFKVRLCPALAGIELVKRGGYLTVELDASGVLPARFRSHPLSRRKSEQPTGEKAQS
jgi:hypothetical protein